MPKKWTPGVATMKTEFAEKKALCFIASYIVSSHLDILKEHKKKILLHILE